MPKRKKHPRLPNAFGSIRYIGKNRTNPYAVHPPALETDENGNFIRPKALCYVDDWYVGFAVLNAYHAGTYRPGDELTFKRNRPNDDAFLDSFCRRLLQDHSAYVHAENAKRKTSPSFSSVYDMFMEWKYGEHAPKTLSRQSKACMQAAFLNCAALHDKVFEDLRLEDLQRCLNDCPLKCASLKNILSLLRQMYRFAIPRELCEKDYAQYLTLPDNISDEHGVPFSDEDLMILWQHQSDPTVEMLLIMCYSGFRISAYRTIEVHLDEWYFKGGIKTAAGKDRIVPIHSAIRPLVFARMNRIGGILTTHPEKFRNAMYGTLDKLGIEKHTPHDCRHTFSRLCEKYHVSENDRKRMLGHSFGYDTTNAIYGHRTVEDLREEIEKIEIPFHD